MTGSHARIAAQMIDTKRFDQRVETLRTALAERLRVRGPDLERQIRRAGRRLPRRQRRAAQTLLGAQDWMSHPRLARLLDRRAVDAAFDEMHRHLDRVDPVEDRRTALLRIAGGIVLNLIIFGVLLTLAWTHLLSP